MSDETEYNGGYKRVFGVKFKQPESANFGLNEESILDDKFNTTMALLGAIPVIGFAIALPGMTVGFEGRHRNEFCLSEQIWKSGVIGMTLQMISLGLALAYYVGA